MAQEPAALGALPDEKVRTVLDRLHREADAETPRMMVQALRYVPHWLRKRDLPWDRLGGVFDDKFIALDRSQGVFCYLLARALGAKRIVEYGTSFGVSTIYLAAAVRDNGGGQVIGSEFVPAKAKRAREHLAEAGLEEWVEIREGDARETLRDLPGEVDFFLNDGFPNAALAVLQCVAPFMRPGAALVTDNVGAFWSNYEAYLAWLADPANGFRSGRLEMNEGTELSVKVAATH